MDDKQRIEDIISMLDGCVTKGVGHINLEVNMDSSEEAITIETYKSNDCSKGNQACAIPTMQESIDKL